MFQENLMVGLSREDLVEAVDHSLAIIATTECFLYGKKRISRTFMQTWKTVWTWNVNETAQMLWLFWALSGCPFCKTGFLVILLIFSQGHGQKNCQYFLLIPLAICTWTYIKRVSLSCKDAVYVLKTRAFNSSSAPHPSVKLEWGVMMHIKRKNIQLHFSIFHLVWKYFVLTCLFFLLIIFELAFPLR